MGQILHGSATTTEAVRRAIQHSQESLRALAKRYGINQKTVAKWKRRTSVVDLPTGPSEPKSTVLSSDEEAIIVAFRRHTLLPLDDCLYSLQATIPHLTRSSLHRCLQRHGISRLPDIEGDKPTKKTFKAYPIGFFHIDIAEVQTGEGKLYQAPRRLHFESETGRRWYGGRSVPLRRRCPARSSAVLLFRLFEPSVGSGGPTPQVLDRHGRAQRGVVAKPAKARDRLQSIR